MGFASSAKARFCLSLPGVANSSKIILDLPVRWPRPVAFVAANLSTMMTRSLAISKGRVGRAVGAEIAAFEACTAFDILCICAADAAAACFRAFFLGKLALILSSGYQRNSKAKKKREYPHSSCQ